MKASAKNERRKMKKQLTLVLTKPEVLEIRMDEVRKDLKIVGPIVLEEVVEITETMIKVMYPNDSEHQRKVNLEYLRGKKVRAFVLEGPNIIEDVVTFVGKETNPERCHPRSLRFRACSNWDFPLPVLMPDDTEYYFNGFHRTKTAEEFEQQAPVILNGSFHKLVSAR